MYHTYGTTMLDVMDSYKIALPSTLQTRMLDRTVAFCSNNSHQMTFAGLSKDRCSELLGSFLRCLFDNFRACLRPKSYLARADETHNPSENHRKSNIGGCQQFGAELAPFFWPGSRICRNHGSWLDPKPWKYHKNGVSCRRRAKDSVAFVFNLLGNSSERFEQFDRTTALPFKSNGKYHLAGKVVVTPPSIFRKVVENITPILKAKGNKSCIKLPPLPRYLLSRCCSDNANEKDFSGVLLSGFVQLKND